MSSGAARKQAPEDLSLQEWIAGLPKGCPLTDEERARIEANRYDGTCIPHEQVMAELAAWPDDEKSGHLERSIGPNVASWICEVKPNETCTIHLRAK